MRSRSLLLALGAASSLIASSADRSALAGPAAPPAPTQTAPAESAADVAFEEGMKAFDAGDFIRAAHAFETANRAQPHESTLYNAAHSWERAGEIARAANLYRKYAQVAATDAPDRKKVAEALEALSLRLGRIDVLARNVASISLDRDPIEETTVFVLPGEHVLEATGKSGALVRRVVSVAAGSSAAVVLESIEEPKVETPKIEPKPDPNQIVPARIDHKTLAPEESDPKRRILPWLSISLGATTVVSGVITIASGIDVLTAKSDYDSIKAGQSRATQQGEINQGVYRTDRTNVLIGITGALALGTGVSLLLTDFRRSRAKLQAGPSGLTLSGEF